MKDNKKKNAYDKFNDKINDKLDNINDRIYDGFDDIKSKQKNNNNNKNKNNDNKFKNEKNNQNLNNKKKKKKNKNFKDDKKKKKNKRKRSFWKKLVTFILIMGILAVLAVAVFLGYIVLTAPKFNENDLKFQEQTIIYDVNGNVITTLAINNEKREIISYDELPQVLVDAIIATEDSRYFQHNGVDLLRFMKAMIMQLLGRGDAGGASTLTMQTVKNMITKKDEVETDRIKKVIRKFQDVYLSVFKIEKKYSKEEILEIYVNDNYLGGGYYGVKEASKYYFGKEVSELTLPEAALIAGLFQLPDGNNPYRNIEGATKRRDMVLLYMYNHGYITEEEKNLAKKVSVESLLVGANSSNNAYQGYIDIVIDEVQELTGNSPYKVPMKIYTTMERSIQDGIDKVFTCEKKDCWFWKNESTQGGVAVVNVSTGAIAAVGAGRNKTGARQWNYATQARKQPGSMAKPLFDYGPGIEYNNFSSYTLFNDEPWSYTSGPSVGNWDGKYEGLLTLRRALQISRNVPALKAFQIVGGKNSQKFVYNLGLDVSYNSSSENYRVLAPGVDNAINEAYAIGGVAEGFTPLEIASAYAAFASGGYYTEPHSITKIEYRDSGEILEFKYNKERVMKDSTAYIMNNILESAVTSGFNGGARVQGSHVAAKTGTTNFDKSTLAKYKLPSYAVNDLWTEAYTSKYSVALWYGYEEVSSTNYNVSGDGAKEAFMTKIMQYIPKDTTGWRMPSSVVAVEVERETWPAKLPSEFTPTNMRTTEYFVRGTQPTEVSNRFAKINDVTNLKSTKVDTNTIKLTWDYTTPDVLTDEYISAYFTSSTVFGKNTQSLVDKRKEYNKNTLGDIVFEIYKQDDDNTLTLLATTKENTYTYKGYGDANLLIIASHEKFKANASSGIKIKLNLAEYVPEELTATLKGSTTIITDLGKYKENGFKNITYGNLNVMSTATIDYQVDVNGTITNYNSASALETYINSLPAGTYNITYVVTYLTNSVKKTRKVILR